MTTRADIFQTLGRIAVLFSTLEAELEESLCIMANEDNPMLAATLLIRTPLERKLQLLEQVAKFKKRTYEIRIKRLVGIIKPLRKKRNLFIHGYWDLSPELLNQGRVAVTESWVQYEESENVGIRMKSWKKGSRQVLTYQQLREFETGVMRALEMTRSVLPSGPLLHAEMEGQVTLPLVPSSV